ncbi:MAG: HPr kinase/phosphatase C-terminal domain-containing protein [Alphaproteobacteria bacterium]|nr:HPr kinase/phosphatase C-terminal domain-containing protein [Alphaproteobacteria bacterium]
MVNLHGTGIVLGGHGLMLRGRSGSGKSLLALQLLDIWRDRGEAAFLVADDRIEITVENGRLVMSAPPNIAGLIELRGRGIVGRPSVARAPLDLVVDMTGELVRFLEDEDLETELEGARLARCPVPERSVVDSAHQVLLVSEAVAQLPPPRTAA